MAFRVMVVSLRNVKTIRGVAMCIWVKITNLSPQSYTWQYVIGVFKKCVLQVEVKYVGLLDNFLAYAFNNY